MKLLRPSIREVLLTFVVLSVAFAWWADRNSLSRELSRERVVAESYQQRLAAIPDSVEKLGKRGAARLLIHALSDPHPQVARAADKSLRQISGISDGFGQIESAAPDERLRIMARWIEWYLSYEKSS